MTDNDDEKRLASGWGRKAPKPAQRDWSGSEMSQRDQTEPAEDLGLAGDATPITGRAPTPRPAEPATRNRSRTTRGGDATDAANPADDDTDANLAQSEPLRDEPPRP